MSHTYARVLVVERKEMNKYDLLHDLKTLVMEGNAGKENALMYSYAELYGMASVFLTEIQIEALIQMVKDTKKS